MKVTFDGPESGAGAKYAWTSQKAGNGELKITESDPAQGIKYNLDFEGGKYRSIGGIRLEPSGSSTKAIWWNEGNLGWRPINRYFGLLMDSMMGPDFQTGLNNLKKKVESAKAAPPAMKPRLRTARSTNPKPKRDNSP